MTTFIIMFNFTKNSIGLDIADRTIELAKLQNNGGKISVLNLGRVEMPEGIVERGRIKQADKLAEMVKKVFVAAKLDIAKEGKVIFALPESQVYSAIAKVKVSDKNSFNEVVFKAVQKNIPLESDNIVYSYKVLSQTNGNRELLLIAASREVVLEWQQFFDKINIKVDYFDFETLAVFRGLAIKNPQEPVCVIDIGFMTANLSIFDKYNLRYSNIIYQAGDLFTKEVSKKLKIDYDKAESKKLKADLTKSDQLAAILIKAMVPILQEVGASLKYWQKKFKQKINRVILVGGSAKLKGLTDYLSSNLEIEVVNGVANFQSGDSGSLYTEAIGLAIRGVDKKWENDPVLNIQTGKTISTEEVDGDSKKKIIICVAIAVVIIGLIILAFWYRNYSRQANQAQKEAALYNLNKNIGTNANVNTPVAEEVGEPVFENIVSTSTGIVLENATSSPATTTDILPETPTSTEALPGEPQIEVTPRVSIKKTPLGWLNVRTGPGLNYPKLIIVYTGEIYNLIEEKSGWTKIDLSDNKSGWVYSIYIERMQ